MGLWDNVKEASKKVSKGIVDTASAGMKAVSDEIARREQEKRFKKDLLTNFTLNDMKAIINFYGFSGPDPYEEDENGRRHKRKLEREDYYDFCMGLTLDKLKKYAERDRRLSYEVRDVISAINEWTGKPSTASSPTTQPAAAQTQMEVNVKSATPVNIEIKPQISEFEEILNAIKNEYEDTIRDQFFRDEDAFNDNLATFLKTKFGNRFSIENTRRLHRDTGDIFINGKYVLEQKYADNTGTLDKGLSELERYREKRYSGVAVVILDTGKITSQVLQYKRWYEERGAKVLILSGKGERKKQKPKFFVGKM